MGIFNLFKRKEKESAIESHLNSMMNQERVVTLPRRTIEEIKHGCKCKTCGHKFYPKKVIIKGDLIKPYNLCKDCDG